MPRGKVIYHYATKDDYAIVLADVSAQFSLKYMMDEERDDPHFQEFLSPLEAPGFGLSRFANGVSAVRFYVVPSDAKITMIHMPDRRQGKKYGFFVTRGFLQQLPQSSLLFTPSSVHKSEQWGEGLLWGHIATFPDNNDFTVFNAFKKSIKKHFEYFRFSGVYVGSEAVKYYEAGGRLSSDLRRPREADAKRSPPDIQATP